MSCSFFTKIGTRYNECAKINSAQIYLSGYWQYLFSKKPREQIGSKSTVDVIGNEKFLRRKVQEEQMKSRFEYRFELAILFY